MRRFLLALPALLGRSAVGLSAVGLLAAGLLARPAAARFPAATPELARQMVAVPAGARHRPEEQRSFAALRMTHMTPAPAHAALSA